MQNMCIDLHGSIADVQREMLRGLLVASDNKEQFEKLSAFLRNFHNYSLQNRFLMYIQRPEISQVASKTKWNQLGRTIKDDEVKRKIWYYAPKMYKVKKMVNGKEEEAVIMNGFKIVGGYDVSQTEGKELEKPVYRVLQVENPVVLCQHLVDRCKANNIEVEYKAMEYAKAGHAALVKQGTKENENIYKIVLNTNYKPEEHCMTLLHELGHIKAKHLSKRSDSNYKEAEAEIAAFLVGMGMGIPLGSENYIQSWTGGVDIPDDSLAAAFSSAEAVEKIVGMHETV